MLWVNKGTFPYSCMGLYPGKCHAFCLIDSVHGARAHSAPSLRVLSRPSAGYGRQHVLQLPRVRGAQRGRVAAGRGALLRPLARPPSRARACACACTRPSRARGFAAALLVSTRGTGHAGMSQSGAVPVSQTVSRHSSSGFAVRSPRGWAGRGQRSDGSHTRGARRPCRGSRASVSRLARSSTLRRCAPRGTGPAALFEPLTKTQVQIPYKKWVLLKAYY